MRLIVVLCLGARVSLCAPGAPAEAKLEDKGRLVSGSQVETWVKAWQQRLHLGEWKIETRIVRATELKPDTLGNLKWNSLTHTAVIKVLSPMDYDPATCDIPEDMEYTIVHELVHLHLSALPRDLNKRDIEETVVNKLADALMGLDRGPAFRARSEPAPRTPKLVSDQPATPEVSRDTSNPKR